MQQKAKFLGISCREQLIKFVRNEASYEKLSAILETAMLPRSKATKYCKITLNN